MCKSLKWYCRFGGEALLSITTVKFDPVAIIQIENVMKIGMTDNKVVYHGSKEIIRFPEIRIVKYNKDFYFGFYCTYWY